MGSRGVVICCLLLYIFVNLIGLSYPQTTFTRNVVPNNYWVFESNQYDSNLPHLEDSQCISTASNISGDNPLLLTCVGPSSTLFDGVIGREGSPEETDLMRHYTWQQEHTPNPNVRMTFDPALVELPNVTMYFYRQGRIRVPHITMCYSQTQDISTCTNDIELPTRPQIDNGVVEWLVTLLTNVTSVTYLEINMEYDRNDHHEDFIFLSEIRIAERQEPTPSLSPSPLETSSQTSMTPTLSATVDNGQGINLTDTIDINSTSEERTREENRYRSKLIIGLSVSFVMIIAIVVFFIILIVCILKRQKKRNLKCNNIPEIPFIVGSLGSDQDDGIKKEQNLHKEPVHLTSRRTITGQAMNSHTYEYCTVASPVPPVYDYVGTKTNVFGKEMELDIYSSPDHTTTNEHQSIDPEGCYSEPALETDYWDNADEAHTGHPYDDVVVTPYHSVYADPEPLEKSNPPLTVTWDNVKPLEALGSGQFGAVVLSEVLHLTEEQIGLSRGYANISSPILVAIKTLKKDPTEENKKAFEKEIKFMSRLNHKNVIRLLGICTKGTPFIMMEYMKNGDLNQFLKKHTFAPRYEMEAEGTPTVDQKILVYISLQIAGGMQYLSGRKFIHRDLATRNVLVGHDFTVKVADFGMSQNLYSGYYFRVRGHQVLPIRWLPFESLKGKFSVKSDVWSFGVTMWEIFTVCKQRPYQGWTDKAVIKDAMKEENRTLLEQTEHCSDEVYAIMKSCWKHNPHHRSNFNDLYCQLYNLYNKL